MTNYHYLLIGAIALIYVGIIAYAVIKRKKDKAAAETVVDDKPLRKKSKKKVSKKKTARKKTTKKKTKKKKASRKTAK